MFRHQDQLGRCPGPPELLTQAPLPSTLVTAGPRLRPAPGHRNRKGLPVQEDKGCRGGEPDKALGMRIGPQLLARFKCCPVSGRVRHGGFRKEDTLVLPSSLRQGHLLPQPGGAACPGLTLVKHFLVPGQALTTQGRVITTDKVNQDLARAGKGPVAEPGQVPFSCSLPCTGHCSQGLGVATLCLAIWLSPSTLLASSSSLINRAPRLGRGIQGPRLMIYDMISLSPSQGKPLCFKLTLCGWYWCPATAKGTLREVK